MSASELLVVFIVAICVFSPKKMPMLAYHIGILSKKILYYKAMLAQIFNQYKQEQILRENILKAEKSDSSYKD